MPLCYDSDEMLIIIDLNSVEEIIRDFLVSQCCGIKSNNVLVCGGEALLWKQLFSCHWASCVSLVFVSPPPHVLPGFVSGSD